MDKNEDLRKLFETEPAKPETLELIEGLADSMVANSQPSEMRFCGYADDTGQNFVYFSEHVDPTGLSFLGTRTELSLERKDDTDGHELHFYVDENDELNIAFTGDDNSSLNQCLEVTQTFLDCHDQLDALELSLIKQVQNIMLKVITGIYDDDDQMNAAEFALGIKTVIRRQAGDTRGYTRQTSLELDESQAITISKLTRHDEPDEDEQLNCLQVVVQEYEAAVVHVYLLDGNGKRQLVTMPEHEYYAWREEFNASKNEPDSLIPSALSDNQPSSQSAEWLLHILMNAGMAYHDVFGEASEAHRLSRLDEKYEIYRLEEVIDSSGVFPDISSFIDLAWLNPGDDPLELAKDTLESLAALDKYILADVYPDNFPAQPNYTYNHNLNRQVDKFLKQTAVHPGTQISAYKRDIVDINTAIRNTLNQLAVINHPVAQAAAVIQSEYQDIMHPEDLRQALYELVIQTHWPLLRRILGEQVSQWRSRSIEPA